MRRVPSFVLAVLLFLVAGVIVERSSLAGDEPKTKKQLRKEQLKKKIEAAKKKAAAEAAAAKKAATTPKPVSTPPATTTQKPDPTPPAKSAKSRTPDELARLIDEQINRKLAEAKVPAGPLATDEEFQRRVYLDLTGIIPTSTKAREFLASTDPQKRTKLIDELLASTNYGKHQADLWVPKLFPRDSANRFVLREPFVKWLTDRFNDNTPWDKFVSDLVSATGTVEENPAVTFFLANRSVDKLTDAVTQDFLGVQLQCAQCHNHPFTGWKQTEYWGMATFFSKVQPQNPRNANQGADNTKLSVRELPTKSRLKDFFPDSTKTVPAKFLGGAEPKLAEREPYRPVLAKWMTRAENPYFARATVNRTWGLLFGRGLINPVDDMHDDAEASHPELLTALTQEFVASGFDLKHLARGICASQAYQRTSKASGGEIDPALFARMTVKVMTPEQLFDSMAQVTGFDKQMARMKENRPEQAKRRNGGGPRDQFVQFYLAGAEKANTTEYEAGIPQALKLMNSRLAGNPLAVRTLTPPGTRPDEAFETIYLTALSRKPTTAEIGKLKEYVAKVGFPGEAYSDILWAVLNGSEFTTVR